MRVSNDQLFIPEEFGTCGRKSSATYIRLCRKRTGMDSSTRSCFDRILDRLNLTATALGLSFDKLQMIE